ncbi:hypothetical protein [Pontimicrobium sp. MEBiC01747]
MNNKTIITFVCSLLIGLQIAQSQQSLKRDKQQTKFHYLQTNFHYGYINEGNIDYLDFSNVGPSNNITYQFLSKNQKQLQKGYVKNIAVNSFKARVSLQFNGGLSEDNIRDDIFSFKPQNIGVSFSTKWDRTSFFVGYGRVKFGHNPKIDPVSDFTANVTRNDIGFNQDLGVFFKSPISANLDGEIGVSIGGTVSKSLLTYNSTIGEFDYIHLDYNGTWLITGRIGSPMFKPFEYGIVGMSGRLDNGNNVTRQINRVGVDILKKIGESWKIGALAVTGNTLYSDNRSDEWNYNLQGNIEYYLKGNYIFNVSNGVLINNYKDDAIETGINGQLINSFSYVASPHTRFRLNHFVNYSKTSTADWGVTFQLITGFGQR